MGTDHFAKRSDKEDVVVHYPKAFDPVKFEKELTKVLEFKSL